MATLLTAVPTTTTSGIVGVAGDFGSTIITPTSSPVTVVGTPVPTCTPSCQRLNSDGTCAEWSGCECIVTIGVGAQDCTFKWPSATARLRSGASVKPVPLTRRLLIAVMAIFMLLSWASILEARE